LTPKILNTLVCSFVVILLVANVDFAFMVVDADVLSLVVDVEEYLILHEHFFHHLGGQTKYINKIMIIIHVHK